MSRSYLWPDTCSTLLPLSSDELSQVAGGGLTDVVRKQMSGGGTLTDHIKSCGPLPRPGATITSGPLSGIGRQVSGASNAF